MLVILSPRPGQFWQPGDIIFTARPGEYLTYSISAHTDPKALEAKRLVATHSGVIIDNATVMESRPEGFIKRPLSVHLNDPAELCWVKRPSGQTPASVALGVDKARSLEGVPYDWGLMAGYALTNPEDRKTTKPSIFEDDDRMICSEAVATVLMAAAPALADPNVGAVLATRHPSWWSPQALNMALALWES